MESSVTLLFRYFAKDNLRHHFSRFVHYHLQFLSGHHGLCQDVYGAATLLVQPIYTSIALMGPIFPLSREQMALARGRHS